MLRLMLLAVIAVALSACAAQGPRRADQASVEIADLDLYFELEFLGPKERERFLSNPAELQKLVETLYFRRRMAQLADEFDYRGDTKLQALMRRDHEYRLAEWVPRRFLESVEVPDLSTRARAYYEENPEKFTPEKALHLQAIFLQATDEKARKARRREAEALLKQLRDGADFGALAEKHSEDAGKFTRGDIGDNIRRGQLFPEVEDAAFALKDTGDLSDVLESPYGFHIFRLLGRRDPAPLPFEQVELPLVEELRTEYLQKALRDWMDEVSPAAASKLDNETLERMAAQLRAEFEAAEAAQGVDGR
jgi:peptidyl-prolyl cis-trans isomerase C